jgi:predicted nucleic acid-binding protein
MIQPVHALSLYLDTSVIGGYHDAEFMADTRALWRLREAGRYRFVSSELVIDEIAQAPEAVRALVGTSFAPADVLHVTVEMEDLAAAYMAEKVVPPNYDDDARHVAICTVARLEHLVSWNFKHLANLRREAGFNAVNVLQGYPPCASWLQPSSSMATKKKTFDAVAESRRWRIQTGRRLAKMTPAQRREHLRRTTEAFFADQPTRHAPALTHR